MRNGAFVGLVVGAIVGLGIGLFGADVAKNSAQAAVQTSVPGIVAGELTGAAPTQTQEVLVTSSAAVAVPTTNLTQRKAIEILNLGPNPIWCALGNSADAVVNKSRRIDALGGTWALDADEYKKLFCIAATANQSTGAATVVTELR